jgi:hypothetical protein
MTFLHTANALEWNDTAATRIVSGTCYGEPFWIGFATEEDVEQWIFEVGHHTNNLVFH